MKGSHGEFKISGKVQLNKWKPKSKPVFLRMFVTCFLNFRAPKPVSCGMFPSLPCEFFSVRNIH